MSTVIIGGGLSGLAAAIRIREQNPEEQVANIEKKFLESNTQVAGMRFRFGKAMQKENPYEEMVSLFAQRNEGIVTSEMKQFASLAVEEMSYWQGYHMLASEDRPEWFGPQFGIPNSAGYGRGLSVIRHLRELAQQAGVKFIEGEVQQLHRSGEYIEGFTYHTAERKVYRAEADTIVLAGGNIGGK